jgi:hypothetical protein
MLNLKRRGDPSKQQQQQNSLIPQDLPIEIQNQLKDQIEQLQKRNFTLDDLHTIILAISADDIVKQHWGVTGLRKMVSIEVITISLSISHKQGPPIQPVIDNSLVPKLIDMIARNTIPLLTLEAACK